METSGNVCIKVTLPTRAARHRLPAVQPGLLKQHKPDIHPGGLGGGGEEDVHHPERGHVGLAGDGRLDGVLGRREAELDQLAVDNLSIISCGDADIRERKEKWIYWPEDLISDKVCPCKEHNWRYRKPVESKIYGNKETFIMATLRDEEFSAG